MSHSLLFAIVDTISILFLGDVMQHREQLHNALADNADSTMYISYDYSSYFENIGHLIEEADFTVANMEFSLGGHPFTGYPAFSAPESLPIECASAGIDLFLCANNHILDRGRRGLGHTFEAYDSIGIPYIGIYRDQEHLTESDPYIADIGGVHIAFINFTYGTNGIPTPAPYIVSRMERNSVEASVQRAEERGADIIIALPHWGTEYELAPSEVQREWQMWLYSLGVDAIIGSHPHVIQPVEAIPDYSMQEMLSDPYHSYPGDGSPSIRVTAFSLGNLISNMSRHDTELGLAFRLDIGIDEAGTAYITGYEAIPLWSARAGKFSDRFTIVPIEEYLHTPEAFIDTWNHKKMVETYERLLPLL